MSPGQSGLDFGTSAGKRPCARKGQCQSGNDPRPDLEPRGLFDALDMVVLEFNKIARRRNAAGVEMIQEDLLNRSVRERGKFLFGLRKATYRIDLDILIEESPFDMGMGGNDLFHAIKGQVVRWYRQRGPFAVCAS